MAIRRDDRSTSSRAAPRDPNSLRATVTLTTSFIGPRRWQLGLLTAMAALGAFLEAVVLVSIARLAFGLASGADLVHIRLGPLGRQELEFWVLVVVVAVLVLTRGTLLVVGARIQSSLSTSVLAETREALLAGYLRASWPLQSAERTGRLQEVVSSFAAQAGASVSLLTQTLVALFSLLAFGVTAFFVNAAAALVVVLVAVLMALCLRPIRARVRRYARRSAEAGLVMATGVSELADGMLEVRVFDVEDQVFDRTKIAIDASADADRRLRNIQQVGPAFYQTTALLVLVLCLAAIHAADVTRLGAIGGVVLIMIRSLSYAQVLQNSYQQFHSSAPSLELVRSELHRYDAEAVDRSGVPITRIGRIEFDHVGFRYEPGTDTLVDLCFEVQPGEVIGIVGPSGAGKSTLVQLLLRLRVPTEGRILVDGRDVAELSIADWYRKVAFVPQDAWLFAGTVGENIAFFRRGVTRAEMETAARRANLHDDVVAMPQGYDTPAGERGGQLSGGQRQRLCIARALVEQPDVLVLDEPTSALDVQSETLIRETLASLTPRTTVFVVAHRLSTLEICDRIMVLGDGRLEGFDTRSRLAVANRFYREALELSGMR